MRELLRWNRALLGLALAGLPGSALGGGAHDRDGFGAAPSLVAEGGAVAVRGRVCPEDLRAAAGVPLADLWRANRSQLMGSASARAPGQGSSLAFRVPTGTPATKAFLGTSSTGGSGGIVQLIAGLVGMLFGLLSGGGVSAANAFPTNPGQLPTAPTPATSTATSPPPASNPFGIPGQNGAGWLDPNQGQQSTAVGANAPTPPSQGDLRSGWIANDPTSGHPRITRGFGNRPHPISGGVKMHSGIDISKARGSGPQAYAVGPSSVVSAGTRGGYGNTVILRHPEGFQTLYAHLASLSVSANSSIAAGTVVGPIGTTGNSTGPHLHFEVLENGAKVDPKPYFPAYPYAD